MTAAKTGGAEVLPTDIRETKRVLQAFQSRRLDETYADLKTDRDYRRIGRFFFEQVYAPQDFSFRDNGIRKLHAVVKGKVYNGISTAVNMAFELQELTERLDDRMVAGMIEAGIGAELTGQAYRAVYRGLDNYEERMHQIDLSVRTIREFHHLSGKWAVGLSLRAARRAARLMGMGQVMEFVSEGYEAFRALKNVDRFITLIRTRETAFNDGIWAETAP